MTAEKRATVGACLALGVFAVAMAMALWAYFVRVESPWTWQSFVSTVSLLGAVVAAVLVWQRPERRTAAVGLGVLAFSLLRVGAPDAWQAGTFAVLAMTAILMIPLVHAVIVLPPRS